MYVNILPPIDAVKCRSQNSFQFKYSSKALEKGFSAELQPFDLYQYYFLF
jgi:hypothetical protein